MSPCLSGQFLWRDDRRSLSENTFVADELNNLIATRKADVLDQSALYAAGAKHSPGRSSSNAHRPILNADR